VTRNRQLTSLPWIVVLTLFVRNVRDAMHDENPKRKLEKITTYFKQFPSDIQMWKKDVVKTVLSYHGVVIKRSEGGRTNLRSVPIETSSRFESLKRLRRIVKNTLEGIGSRKSLSFRFTTGSDNMTTTDDTVVVEWKKRLPSHQASLRKDFEQSLLELYDILMSIETPSNVDITTPTSSSTNKSEKTPVISIISNILERMIEDIRDGPQFRLCRTGVGFDGSKKVKISFVDEENQRHAYEKMVETLENSDVPSGIFDSTIEMCGACVRVLKGGRALSEMWRASTCSVRKLRQHLEKHYLEEDVVKLNESFNTLRSLICARLASSFSESSVTQLLKYENTDPCVLSATLASAQVLMKESKDLLSRCNDALQKMRVRRRDMVRLEMTERLDRLRRVAHERRIMEATNSTTRAEKSPPSPPPSSPCSKESERVI
jgi:hypothetical protein